MKIRQESEIELNVEDGFYHFDGVGGFKEYWEVRNGNIITDFTITKDQISYLKHNKAITHLTGNPFLASRKISQAEYLEAKHLLIDRITE